MLQDLDLLQPAIAQGDAEAFGEFLASAEWELRESLRSFAKKLDVEAIVQESALRLWQVAPSFQPDGRPNGLLRLLVRIARNLAIDELRRRTREETRAEPPTVEVRDALPDPALRKAIRDCLVELPAKPRLAIEARIESDGAEPDAALAFACEMRPNTFLQNVTRARKLLADCLQKKGVPLFGGAA
jgi:RNA polymerase sigma-70 factor (ECF subfamily)